MTPNDLVTPNDLRMPRDLVPPPPDFAGEQLRFDYISQPVPSGKPASIAIEVSPPAAIPVALNLVTGPGTMTGTVSGMTDTYGQVTLQPQFDRAGAYTVSVTSPDAAPATTSFRVAGLPHWTVQPHDATGGTVQSPSPTVTLLDATGAVDTVDNDIISLVRAFDSSCPTVLGNVKTTQGVAVFDNMAVNTACAGYRLDASTSWGNEESVPFDITIGPPAKIALVMLDFPLAVGIPFRVRGEIVDAGGNVVDVPTTTITLSVAGATLGGTTSAPTVGSVATFTNLTVDRAGVFSLDAAGGGWTGSTTIGVSAWQRRLFDYASNLAVDYANADEVYRLGDQLSNAGSVWQSTDGAVSFSSMGSLPYGTGYSGIVVDPLTPLRLYVAGAAGLFRSDNGGVSFELMGAGLPTTLNGPMVALDPRTADVYVLNAGQLWRSSDGAATFAAITPTLANLRSVAIDPSTSAIWVGGDGALWVSNDFGASWSDHSTGLPSSCSIMRVVVSPIDSATIFAGCSTSGATSIDGGVSWTSLSGPAPMSVVVDAGGTWYSPIGNAGQLWKSADGVAWRNVQNAEQVLTVVPIPGHPGWLYGLSLNWIYRTKSGGE